ncbi:MAG: cupin domain-containing protein [Phycisphaerae bacterium]
MSIPFEYVADLRAAHAVPERGTLSRALRNDDCAKVVWFGFAAGEELSEHTASMPATLHFVCGEAEVMLGGERVEARAGTWIYMPAHLKHAIRVKTPTVMLLTLIKTPARSA